MPPCWSTVSAPMPTDLSACSTSRPCWHSGAGCRVTANGTADRRLVDALGRRFQPPRRSADGGAETIVGLSLIHISEPTRLLSISYAVFCLKKKTTIRHKERSIQYHANQKTTFLNTRPT